MTGSEKRKLLVIGKSLHPRCFKNVKELPVHYFANKKSWMTSSIFEEELRKWDKELSVKNRKILLLVDNCPAHPRLNLTNINLVFLPVNSTSILQPMDQGVIRSLKSYYRKQLLKKILFHMDSTSCVKISLLDAIEFLYEAWKSVTPQTIANCFRKAQLTNNNTFNDDSENDEDNMPLSQWIQKCSTADEFGNELDLYEAVDDHVETFEILSDSQIVESVKNAAVEDDSDDESAEPDEESSTVCPTVQEAMSAVTTLSRFYRYRETPAEILMEVDNIYRVTETIYFGERRVQKKITDFFQ